MRSAIGMRRIQPAKLYFWPSSNLRGEDPPQLLIALRVQSEKSIPSAFRQSEDERRVRGFPFLISFIESRDAPDVIKVARQNSLRGWVLPLCPF